MTQSRKRVRKAAPTLASAETRRLRTLLIGLATRHEFQAGDLAAILNISVRHVRREAATFRRVSHAMGRHADAE